MGIKIQGLKNPVGLRVGSYIKRIVEPEKTITINQETSHISSQIVTQEENAITIGSANITQYPVGSTVLVTTVNADSATYASEVGKYDVGVVVGNNGVDTIVMNELNNTYDPVNTTTLVIKTDFYDTFTVEEGISVTTPGWDGSAGGVTFIAANNIVINGTISANSAGYRPGNRGGNNSNGRRGESIYAGIYNANNRNSLMGAGGAGLYGSSSNGDIGNGGGNAGHATAGTANIWYPGEWTTRQGLSGDAIIPGDLSRLYFGPGGGGGAGDADTQSGYGGYGGRGGGMIVLMANNITIGANGIVTSTGGNGANPYDPGNGEPGGGGAGAGGTILFTSSGTVNVTNNGSITTSGGTTSRANSQAGQGVVAIKNGYLTGNTPTDATIIQ